MTDTGLLVTFAVAVGLGAAIGLERQVDDRGVETGARTFALYAIWGAAASLAGDVWGGVAFGAFALGFLALVVASHVVTVARTGDTGTTTEAAQVATFVVGILAHLQEWTTAVAVAIVTAVVLGSKEWVQGFVGRLSPADTRAALQFAVLTGIVLPLVPDQSMGPYGAVNPREVWLMVVFVSAIGLAGYIGLRAAGDRGIGATGMLGGIVSSTAVTLGFGRMSRTDDALRPALAAGILGASGLMYPRILVEAFATAPALGARLAPVLVGLTVVVGAAALWWWRHPVRDRPTDLQVENPLTLKVALQFGALYALIVLIARMLVVEASTSSLYALSAVSGLADVDAITLSVGNLVGDGLDVGTGARAVLVAAAVNTALKAGLVLLVGTAALARSVGGVLVPTAVVAAAIALFL